MSKGGRYLKKKPAGGKGKKVVLILLLVLVLLIGGIAGGGWWYYNHLLDQIPKAEYSDNSLSDEQLEEILGYVPEKESTAATEETTEATTVPTEPKAADYGKTGKIVNIMLVGQQSREGESTKLSDTMILCTINKETKTLTLTSFLRDLYIQLPNYKGHVCGQQRINVAYNLGWHWAGDLGGMEMLNMLIYNNFGVEVDHNVEVDFTAFEKIIDIFGGIDVELTAEEAAYLSDDSLDYYDKDAVFEEGMNHMDGFFALHYARMRKSSANDNDFKRTSRQRELIGILLEKCKTMSLSELNEIIDTVLPMILTNMTNEEITTYILELLPLLPELTMVSNQCPAEETYWGEIVSISGVESGVIKCNVQKNKELLMAIAEEPVVEETQPAG